MNWFVIEKDDAIDEVNDYSKYKEKLSIEGRHQCVYCCVTEENFGGIRNFHVEHYRPKSKFKSLTHSYKNLFYSCSICNCFKGNDWPNEPSETYQEPFYPNPTKVDYREIISVDYKDGYLKGQNITAKYLVEKLFLNRPQLIIDRKHNLIKDKINSLIDDLRELRPIIQDKCSKPDGDSELLNSFFKASETLDQITEKLNKVKRPYELSDIIKDDK